jgi:hypothetical protein
MTTGYRIDDHLIIPVQLSQLYYRNKHYVTIVRKAVPLLNGCFKETELGISAPDLVEQR